jgi:hypothetical protein
MAARTAFAAGGPEELAAGTAARAARPPDLPLARAHFEAAAQADDPRSAAEALYFLAELDDADLSFASALARYEASAARLPSSRYTPRANSRANELRTHSEGGFQPLVKLETVRRSPRLASDPAAIDGLLAASGSFPPGKVRVEARMLVLEAYRGRLGRKDEALPLLRLVVDDPKADVLTARAAASELRDAYVAKGDLAGALEIARRYRGLLAPSAERDVLRLMRRRPLRVAAWSDLALLVGLAILAAAGPARRRVLAAVRRLAPLALAFATVAAGVAGFLASQYEQTSPYPFATMLPAMFVIGILARAASAGGDATAGARALRAAIAFAAVFAAAFLLLDRMDPIYLQGFGL